MKPERFYTEARLLSSTRADGHQASALDNGNTYQYVTGVGWVQLLPSSGVEGQALVVGPTELTSPDVPGPIRHRSKIEFGSHNKFVPEADADNEGQVASIDEEGETVLTAPTFTVVPGGITYPLTFADASLQFFVSRTIPGGALGPNGFLRATTIIRIINTPAGRTVTMGMTSPGLLPSLTTANLTSTVNNHGIHYEFLMFNANDETVQTGYASIKNTLFVSGAATSSTPDESFETIGAIAGVDTSADWTLAGQIQLSNTVLPSGTAWVYGCAVEYGYSA